MKIITIILLLTFSSCKNVVSIEKEVVIEQTESQNSAEKIAVDFINHYVEYCNDLNSEQGLIEWVFEQQNVSKYFKTELKRVVTEAEKKEPELGLGFDPIFNAQDYPENGFELDQWDNKSKFLTVKSKDSSDFKLKIKMIRENEIWFVNGIGIINMTEKERIKR